MSPESDQKWKHMHITICENVMIFITKVLFLCKNHALWAGANRFVRFRGPKWTPKSDRKLLKVELTSGLVFGHVFSDFWAPF